MATAIEACTRAQASKHAHSEHIVNHMTDDCEQA
jgi:hypothetical protein